MSTKQLKTRVIRLSPLNNQNVNILQDLRSMVNTLNTLNRHKRLSLMAQVIDLETAAIAAGGEFNKKAIVRLYTLSQKIDHNLASTYKKESDDPVLEASAFPADDRCIPPPGW